MDRRQQEYNQMEREREENEMLTQNLLYLNAERTVVRQQVSSYQNSTPSRNVVKKVMVRTNNNTNITPSRSFLTPQAQSFVRTTTVASPAVFSQTPPRITSTATLSTATRGSITHSENDIFEDQSRLSPTLCSTPHFNDEHEDDNNESIVSSFHGLLIDTIQTYQCLWRVASSSYKDKNMRQRCWVEIGELLGKEGEFCFYIYF